MGFSEIQHNKAIWAKLNVSLKWKTQQGVIEWNADWIPRLEYYAGQSTMQLTLYLNGVMYFS
jgi:hypothetical protein